MCPTDFQGAITRANKAILTYSPYRICKENTGQHPVILVMKRCWKEVREDLRDANLPV